MNSATRPNPAVASGFAGKSITLSSGITLEYVRRGDPLGIPVLLLHGVSDSWRSFEWMLPYLPPEVDAYAISVRGHGGSDKPSHGYEMQDFARDIDGFMQRLGIPTAVVVGHSMGSAVALRLALDYPARVRGLVLMGAMASWGANPPVQEVAETVTSFSDTVDPAFIREFQLSTVATPVPGIIEVAVDESLRVPVHVWKEAFAGIVHFDVTRDLSRITVPTLLMWGGKETFATRHAQEELLRGMKAARLVVFEHAGHAVHWEEPARVARDIAAFVAEL